MTTNSSALSVLNYPNAGPSILIMGLLALIGLLATVFMLVIILKYDSLVNRQTTLLTKTYNMTEWVRLLYTVVILLDYIVILTGLSFHPYICYGYTLLDHIMASLYLLTNTMEAVVHYFFLVKSSRFLIIKDDLLCIIFWRSAVAISIATTVRYFTDLKKMPRPYHFCTGTEPTEQGELEAKCDGDNREYEIVVAIIYMTIFITFTAAVCIENFKQRRSLSALQEATTAQCKRSPSTKSFMDNLGFTIKMVNAVFSCSVVFAYNEMGTDQLSTFPGSLIFYIFHLWLIPVATIAERMRRFWVDRHLCTYARRHIRPSMSVGPMAVMQ